MTEKLNELLMEEQKDQYVDFNIIAKRSYLENFADAWNLGAAGQFTMRTALRHADNVSTFGFYPDMGEFTPTFEDVKDYPLELAKQLYQTNSRLEFDHIIEKWDYNTERRQNLAQQDAFWTELSAGFVQPENLVPFLGMKRGLGWLGNIRSAVPGAAAGIVPAEVLRHEMDPTSTMAETITSSIFGTAFGAGFAGSIGHLGDVLARSSSRNFSHHVSNDRPAADESATISQRYTKEEFEQDYPDVAGTYEDFIANQVKDELGDVARYQMDDGRQLFVRTNDDGTLSVLERGGKVDDISLDEIKLEIDAESGELSIEFGKTDGGSLGATRPSTGQIILDADSIRADYEAGMPYLRGGQGATSEQTSAAMLGIDLGALKKWFDNNGGVNAYIRFIAHHEIGHAKAGHTHQKLMSKKAIAQEIEANRYAFERLGIDESGLRAGQANSFLAKVKPEEIAGYIDGRHAKRVSSFDSLEAKSHVDAGVREGVGSGEFDNNGVEFRLHNTSERRASYDAEVQARMAALDKKIEDIEAQLKGRAIKDLTNEKRRLQRLLGNEKRLAKQAEEEGLSVEDFINQINARISEIADEAKAAREAVKEMRPELEAVLRSLKERKAAEEQWHKDLEQEGLSPEDFAPIPVMGGIERKLGALDMPWYRMTGTKLRKLAPELATSYIKLARKIAGSPDLIQGSSRAGTGASVEGMAKQWEAKFAQATEDVMNEYSKMIGGAEGRSAFRIYASDKIKSISDLVNGLESKIPGRAHDAPVETKPMRLAEFYDRVGEHMMTGKQTDPHIKAAAKKMQDLLDEMGGELEKMGALNSTAGLTNRAARLSARIDQLKAGLDDYKNPAAIKRIEALIVKYQDELAITEAEIKASKNSRVQRPKEPFFHRVWDPETVKTRIDDLRKILTDYYSKYPTVRVGNKIKTLSTHPDAIAERVDDTINEILGEVEKGDSLNTIKDPNASGLPSAMLGRRLDIPNSYEVAGVGSVADFLVKDVRVVNAIYVQRVAPQIEMIRQFGDNSMTAHLEDLEIKALEANHGKAVMDEIAELHQSARDLRDVVLGNYYVGPDPSSLSSRTIRGLMQYNMITSMGRVLFVTLNDVGKGVAAYGFRKAFGGIARGFLDQDFKIAKKEVQLAGEALDLFNNQRAYEMLGAHGDMIGRTRIERWNNNMTGLTFIVNLMSPWTDHIKGVFGGMMQSRMIEDAINWNSLSKSRKAELGKIGFTEGFAKRVVQQWKKAGSQKGENLLLANTGAWDDIEAVRQFRGMLADETNRLVMTPGAATQPLWAHNDWVKPLIQYKKFSMIATQNLLMAGLQRNEARYYAAMGAMIMVSAFVDMVKSPDYIQLSFEDRLFRAIEISGVTGIILDANQMLEGATGGEWGARAAFGLENTERDPTATSRAGAVLGPVANQWGTLIQAMVDPDQDTADLGRAIRYTLPWNNMIWWNDMSTRVQRSTVDFAEDFQDEE